jgi:hypothetical protein
MAILKYLDLSTAHFKQSTIAGADNYRLADYPYGTIFYVPEVVDVGTPRDLADVLEYALASECVLVRADADGDTVEGLPVYDW